MKKYLSEYWRYFKCAAHLPLTLTPKYFDWPAFWRDMREAATSLGAVLFLVFANLIYPVSVIVAPFFAIASDRRAARSRAAYLARRDVQRAAQDERKSVAEAMAEQRRTVHMPE